MTGYVDEKDKPYLYGMAAAFVFPSLYEGFGMPIIEAMASGTAVVTADNSSLPEAGGDAALYAEATDREAIAKNMQKLITDDQTRAHCIERGIANAKTFSWKDSADKTVKVYESVLGEL